MTGGGLFTSADGGGVLKSMRKMRIDLKGDERIPAAGNLVEEAPDHVFVQMDRRRRLREKRHPFDRLSKRVGRLFGVDVKEILIPGKQPPGEAAEVYRATALLLDWA